jgi:serine/threonine-protein kinase
METVARAVAAAHAAGVIHRDLKPSNILLSTDGVPKVTDFGLAKRLDTADGLTVTDVMLGTPGYMAPEQAGRRNAEIGPLSDVYSLGATLYALLSGRAPFRGTTPLETAQRVLTVPPIPPRHLRPDLPPDLEAVVLKCLEKSPAKRYASADDLADDLARWGRGEPTVARPLTRWGKARRALRRRVKPIAAVALLLAGLAGLLWAAPADRAPDPIQQAQRDLSLGNPVTLIGETGLPRYPHRWALGPTALGESMLGDKSCSFESIGLSLLELFPAPEVDRYRVTADLRILQTKLVPPEVSAPKAGIMNTQLVGLYFGHAESQTAENVPAHTFFALTYNDILSESSQARLIKRKATPRASVQVKRVLIIQRPDRAPFLATTWGSRSKLFPPRDTLPGAWRRVCVEVTPDGVTTYCALDPADGLEPIDTVAAGRLSTELSSIPPKATFFTTHPEAVPTALPNWQPRMPLGVWCSQGRVAVKNVVIESIP